MSNLKIKCLKSMYKFPDTKSKRSTAIRKLFRKELLDHEQTEIIIGKEGWYLQGKKCWFETDGKAYISDEKQFKFDLLCLTISELDKSVAIALETLQKVAPNIMTKHQKNIISCTEFNKEIKQMNRDMKLFLKTIKLGINNE
jgi:hypothetical protein